MEQKTEEHQYRVVVVDDDPIQMRPFFVEMNSRGIDAISLSDADQCFDYIESGSHADIYVIDIMLRSSKHYSAALTNNYQLTGLSVARDVRRFNQNTPIILFSNTVQSDLVTEIRKVAEKIGNCVLIQKYTISEFGQFGYLIETILVEGVKNIASKNFWKRLKESIFLKPSFFGVGVDLKTLTKK